MYVVMKPLQLWTFCGIKISDATESAEEPAFHRSQAGRDRPCTGDTLKSSRDSIEVFVGCNCQKEGMSLVRCNYNSFTHSNEEGHLIWY